MDVLGLPDPGDYNPPTNDPVADHNRTVTAGAHLPVTAEPVQQPAETSSLPTAAPAPTSAPDEPEITPFPPAPPTVEGVNVTESVYQQGV